jgi:hypothetical protein
MGRQFPPLVLLHGWHLVQANAGTAVCERQGEARPFGSKWFPDELHFMSAHGKSAQHGLILTDVSRRTDREKNA